MRTSTLPLALFLVGIAVSASARVSRADRPATTQAPLNKIAEFQGDYRFLSNFWPAEVVYDDITYPTAEHAYQAAKTLDVEQRKQIAALKTPAEAKPPAARSSFVTTGTPRSSK